MNTYIVEWLQADWVETVREINGVRKKFGGEVNCGGWLKVRAINGVRKKFGGEVNCGGWLKVRAKSEQAAVDAFRESNGIKPRAKIHAMICPA